MSVSFVHGPSEPVLVSSSIGHLLDRQSVQFSDREAVIFPAESVRYTYYELNSQVKIVCRALMAHGIRAGDRVGVFSGNCVQYVEVFLATTRIGAITVMLNNAYSTRECLNALMSTGCSLLFTTTQISNRDLSPCLTNLNIPMDGNKLPDLRHIILLQTDGHNYEQFQSYDNFLGQASMISESSLFENEKKVQKDQVCTFQFTSGTTGAPKIAMLTHTNVINNGYFIGHRLLLSEQDVVCCPYPLFHISGICIGLLSCLTHGAAIVYPSSTFDPSAVLQALVQEKCTTLHGVPTIFVALLERSQELNLGPIDLRAGLVGGASTPVSLLKDMRKKFGFEDLTVAYGMTETSPISFMSRASDQPNDKVIHRQIMPHTSAKIVDASGNIVPPGTRGEICISGPCVQKGYYKSPEKTREALKKDPSGTVWMHTGDEAMMDEQGGCIITGRIKDIIVRGAENVYPAEIEERLDEHQSISQSCVVGVKHENLGEEVAAFLQLSPGHSRPSDSDITEWILASLGTQKTPLWIFWLGDGDVPSVFPITDSGKIKKNEMAELGNQLILS